MKMVLSYFRLKVRFVAKRIGDSVIKFTNPVYISSFASVVGKLEGEGPLGKGFDMVFEDELVGQDSFEQAESRLQQLSAQKAIEKGGKTAQDISAVFAGDLLNQCVGSSYGLRDMNIPFAGLYGACSTMALSLCVAAMFVDSGAGDNALAVTSSHFCSAERQFRFPLEYGGQRPQSAQWTVTGSGSAVVSNTKSNIKIEQIVLGRIVDLGVTDMNNMGAAMAPAAADTIKRFFDDTNTSPSDYDAVFTGDLGSVGSKLLSRLLYKEGVDLNNHNDCGLMIYDLKAQDVHAGGSGCGCSASVLCSNILNRVNEGELKNILFCATGALMSPTTSMQGETIPSIAHLVNIRHCE